MSMSRTQVPKTLGKQDAHSPENRRQKKSWQSGRENYVNGE